jgi:hypothetical protein
MLTRHAVSHFRYFGILLAVLLLGSNLSACHLDEATCTEMPASWSAPAHTVYDAGTSGTQIHFNWYYPGTCEPDRFRIIMNDIPYIGAGLLYDEYVLIERGSYVRTVFEDGSSAISFSWTTEETFVDGPYWWWVIPYSGDYAGERSPAFTILIDTWYPDAWEWGYWCTEENWHLEVVPEPVYPANGSTIHTMTPTLIWRNRNPQLTRCYVPPLSRYAILYSQETDDLDLAEISLAQPGIDPFSRRSELILPPEISLAIPPPSEGVRSMDITLTECNRTYWRVYLQFLQSDIETSVVWPSEIFYFDVDPALCEGESVSEFFVPMLEVGPPTATAKEPANCRSGPTTEYPLLSILPSGNQYAVEGRNQAGDAWQIFDPGIDNTCWVFGDLVEVTGDTNQVPIIEAAPLQPTPTDTSVPYNCAQYTGLTCEADNHPCKWTGNVCVNE